MLRGAKLTLEANVDGTGTTTGVFDLSGSIEISPRIRTGDLIGPTGSTFSGLIDIATGSDSGRASWRLDAGGGAYAVDLNFRSWEGSNGRWGDGTSNAKADAQGEGVYRQLSVLMRYLNRGTFDSREGTEAFLEWGEYSSSGEFAPIKVAVEEPRLTFTADEQSSVFDGSITLIATNAITEAAVSQDQNNI